MGELDASFVVIHVRMLVWRVHLFNSTRVYVTQMEPLATWLPKLTPVCVVVGNLPGVMFCYCFIAIAVLSVSL